MRLLQAIRYVIWETPPNVEDTYRSFLRSLPQMAWTASTIDMPLDLTKLSLISKDALLEVDIDRDMLPEPNGVILNDGQREMIKAMLRTNKVKEEKGRDGSRYSHCVVPATSPFLVQGVSGDGSEDRTVQLAISSRFEPNKSPVHQVGYLDADGIFGFVLFDSKFAWGSLENTVVSRATRGELEDITWKVLTDAQGNPTALYVTTNSSWYPSDMA
jgi:hypothetical protein